MYEVYFPHYYIKTPPKEEKSFGGVFIYCQLPYSLRLFPHIKRESDENMYYIMNKKQKKFHNNFFYIIFAFEF